MPVSVENRMVRNAESAPYLLRYRHRLLWGFGGRVRIERVDVSQRRLDVAEAATGPTVTIVWGTAKSNE